MRVGVFDSGLGGLSVLFALQRSFPAWSFHYLGDTARTPYGTKSQEVVKRYANECLAFLARSELDCAVVACNTISSLALESLREQVSFPVIGTIESTVGMLEEANSQNILLLGTPGTISSGAYQRAILEKWPKATLYTKDCPLFVPLVESGFFDGPIVQLALEHYLQSFQQQKLSLVVLGCTHYPFLRSEISQYFQGRVDLLESSEGIVRELSLLFPDRVDLKSDREIRLSVTDPLGSREGLAKVLGDSGLEVEVVQIDV